MLNLLSHSRFSVSTIQSSIIDIIMDHGWIATYGSNGEMNVQISFASQGGTSTPTPDFSIEVDDVDLCLERMKDAGFQIEYGPVDEPWGG